MSRLQHEAGLIFRLRVVVDLHDIDAASAGNQRNGQIAQTACVDSSQRALARRMTASRSAANDSLDVMLYSIECDVEHGNAKSVLAGKLGLLERNGAPKGRFQRE